MFPSTRVHIWEYIFDPLPFGQVHQITGWFHPSGLGTGGSGTLASLRSSARNGRPFFFVFLP